MKKFTVNGRIILCEEVLPEVGEDGVYLRSVFTKNEALCFKLQHLERRINTNFHEIDKLNDDYKCNPHDLEEATCHQIDFIKLQELLDKASFIKQDIIKMPHNYNITELTSMIEASLDLVNFSRTNSRVINSVFSSESNSFKDFTIIVGSSTLLGGAVASILYKNGLSTNFLGIFAITFLSSSILQWIYTNLQYYDEASNRINFIHNEFLHIENLLIGIDQELCTDPIL